MDAAQDSKSPLVSVVLIVRNGGNYLSPQIDSILAQTYTNLELLICDDCSTDQTPQLAQDYMRRDPRVRYVRNEVNLHVSLTFDRQCHLCRGEFIAPSDADDVWLPQKIEKQVAYLMAHPETQMVFTDDMVVNEDLSMKLGSFQKKIGNPSRGGRLLITDQLKRNFVPFHVSCFRSTVLPKLLPMPKQSVITYDGWAAFVCLLNGPIGYIDECLVLYRQHQSNMVGAGTRDNAYYIKRVNDAAVLREYINSKSSQMPIYERLLAMEPGKDARRALLEKVAIQSGLLKMTQAAAIKDFVRQAAKAGWTIFKTSQKFHVKQWLFLIFSWPAIKRMNSIQ
jgi:glycosyltransferase involved in cell wall biosynthesis